MMTNDWDRIVNRPKRKKLVKIIVLCFMAAIMVAVAANVSYEITAQSMDVPTLEQFSVAGTIQIVQVGALADRRVVVVARGKRYGAERTIVLPKSILLPVWHGEKTLLVTVREFTTTTPDGKSRTKEECEYQFK